MLGHNSWSDIITSEVLKLNVELSLKMSVHASLTEPDRIYGPPNHSRAIMEVIRVIGCFNEAALMSVDLV